ncbi:MAG: hypothetical protein LWW96_20315 [Acidovorax sp.]|uniref:hypothetical protein n=1 Tax=Acidovorax sp. TaxID=1872122 RepID=UPI0025C27501|nr:hypothetical protein [Acidovorax sp.]MCE1194496.1 hypothetical protein [Acidovorax sp.]
MTEELIGASAALASLLALAQGAQAMSTRAWGDGVRGAARVRAGAVALATLVLQTATAATAAGPAAGVALVLAAWMALGWLLVLGMNQWPAAARRWAVRLGVLGCAGCAVALGSFGWRLMG